MKYTSVYHFMVLDELKRGKTIYALDRYLREVIFINSLTVDRAIAVLNSADEDPKRYEFWYDETEEIKNA